MRFIDLSHTVSPEMAVYPGDLPVELWKDKEIREDGYNNYQLRTGMHVGTHVDGPMHLTSDYRYISDISLAKFSGKGVVFNVQGIKKITLKDVNVSEIGTKKIVLFYSGLDKSFGDKEYFMNHPVLEQDLINLLVKERINLIGMDWPSPDLEPYPMHQILLKNEILILENLNNLGLLLSLDFEIFAFPLKIRTDSSLIRAVARIND